MYSEKEQAFWDWLELQSEALQEMYRKNIEHLAARNGGKINNDQSSMVWRIRQSSGYDGNHD